MVTKGTGMGAVLLLWIRWADVTGRYSDGAIGSWLVNFWRQVSGTELQLHSCRAGGPRGCRTHLFYLYIFLAVTGRETCELRLIALAARILIQAVRLAMV